MTDSNPNPDKQLPHKDINSELEAHFRIIQSCSVKTNDGERILLAARPESRYPYFYPRDAACASGLLAYLSTSGLSIADIRAAQDNCRLCAGGCKRRWLYWAKICPLG